MINAHGQSYESVEHARDRIAVLRDENAKYGESDGRVTEINAIEEAIALVWDANDEVTPGYVVVKQEYGMPCDHPACAILHKRLSREEFSDGKAHWVDVHHNGRDSQVLMTRWHERKITEWVILLDGKRVGNAHDTKAAAQHEVDTTRPTI